MTPVLATRSPFPVADACGICKSKRPILEAVHFGVVEAGNGKGALPTGTSAV
jgi:hypothetical protein